MCDTHNTSFTFKFRFINNLGFFLLRSSDGGAYFCFSKLTVAFASSLARETLAQRALERGGSVTARTTLALQLYRNLLVNVRDQRTVTEHIISSFLNDMWRQEVQGMHFQAWHELALAQFARLI
jgi:hypothetical protein